MSNWSENPNHGGRKFSPSLTLLSFKTRIEWPLMLTAKFPNVFFHLLQYSRHHPSFSTHKAALMRKNCLDFSIFFFNTWGFRSSICCKFSFHEKPFESSLIFLDQSQLFSTHSFQWDCFILYRQQITSYGFFIVRQSGRLSSKDERFWNKKPCYFIYLLYWIKQIDFMLPCACSLIDYRGRQNVIRTLVKPSAFASFATFLFLPHSEVICDLSLNRRMATWNLFVK